MVNAQHQTPVWNFKIWLWTVPNIVDVSFPFAIEGRTRPDQEHWVDAIFSASSKIWHKFHILFFALQTPFQGLECKSTKMFACRIAFEAHLLNSFQHGGKVGEVV